MPRRTDMVLQIRTAGEKARDLSISEISRRLRKGRLLPDDEASLPDAEDWQPLRSLLSRLDCCHAAALRISGPISAEFIDSAHTSLSHVFDPAAASLLGAGGQAKVRGRRHDIDEAREYFQQRLRGDGGEIVVERSKEEEPDPLYEELTRPSNYTKLFYSGSRPAAPVRPLVRWHVIRPVFWTGATLALSFNLLYGFSELLLLEERSRFGAPAPTLRPVSSSFSKKLTKTGFDVRTTSPRPKTSPISPQEKSTVPEVIDPAEMTAVSTPGEDRDLEMERIESEFLDRVEAEITGPFAARVIEMETEYLGALRREQGRAEEQGDVLLVRSIQDEITRVQTGAERSSNPVPSHSPNFNRMRSLYEYHSATFEVEETKRLIEIIAATDEELAAHQKKLMATESVEAAFAVYTVRQRLAELDSIPDFEDLEELEE